MNDNPYNTCFYANACHVCKKFGKNVHLKRCGNCLMISYCGRMHQQHHWPQHKQICMVIKDVLKNNRLDTRVTTAEEWIRLKTNLMLLVNIKLGRHLEHYEKQMFKFRRACVICHELEELTNCENCASACFCSKHRDDPMHNRNCKLLRLCFDLDVTYAGQAASSNICYLQHLSNNIFFSHMNDFIDICVRPWNDPKVPSNVWAAIYSDYVTRPLTLFFGMRVLKYSLHCKDLTVHVIAANLTEIICLQDWEILLHLIPALETARIIMIGPELIRGDIAHNVCNDCILQKKLTFEFYKLLYEEYVGNDTLFKQPDLVIGFNAGIHECESHGDTWVLSIQRLAQINSPLILSAYTREEAKKEKQRINNILNNEIENIYCGKNPFASLRPHRDFETENLYYQNNYLIVYRSLCP